MNILIASDHAGFELKSYLIETLGSSYNFSDIGCFDGDNVDYPDIAKDLCRKLTMRPNKYNFAILICGTGIGVSIAVNRFKGVRAALCHNVETAKLARNHNDANILCLGARIIDKNIAVDCCQTFLSSKFEGGRHLSRIKKID